MTKEQVDINPQPYTFIFSTRSPPCGQVDQKIRSSQISSKFKYHSLDQQGVPNPAQFGKLQTVPCIVIDDGHGPENTKIYGLKNAIEWLDQEGVMPISFSDSYDSFANSYSFIENTYCPTGVGCASFEYLAEGNTGNGLGITGGITQSSQQPQQIGMSGGGMGGGGGNPREQARMSEMDKRMEQLMNQRKMDVPTFNRH